MNDKLSAPLDEFKEREVEIINLMADGLSNKEIADRLFITKETVRWYNKQIYSKLGTSRRTEAIALAREMNVIGDSSSEELSTQNIQHKLPVTTGPFIGRDADLSEFSDLLHNPDIRLLSIIATGGMGKSRCALELGHLIKANYEHGAVFIDLTSVRKPDDIANHTLSSLGLSINDNQKPQEVLFDYCREKELLLIFDNFEDVLTGANLLTDILEHAPRVTIIATSRERLNLRAETVVYLEPIIENGDKLFIELASMMRPNIVIEEQELADIQSIVALVGGLPLGLVLAVTWIDTLSIYEIAEEIQANLDFLSAEMGDMPERQRSIHAVIEPTWNRLKENEQKAFMWASIFRGGFTRELFQKVTSASIRTLQTLQNHSLIHHGQGRRYDMHPLLRQYAHERLHDSELFDDAKQVHLEKFVEYAQSQNDKMYSGYYMEALEALDIEQDNFRTALDWSFSGHETDTGVALLLSLTKFWITRSQIQESIYYLEQGLKYQQNETLHMQLGYCQYRIGQVDKAKDNIREAIALAQETQSLDILANSYRISALFREDTSAQETQNLLEIALEYAETSEVPRVIAACHGSIGIFLSEMATPQTEIFEHYQKELEIWEELGDLLGISRTIYNMAVEYDRQGDRQEAKKLCNYSLKLKRQIGDKAGIARRLSVLAAWDINEEELERASSYLAESRIICEELGEQSRLTYTLGIEGLLHIIKMEAYQAQGLLQRGLTIAQAIKHYTLVEQFHSHLALLYLLQGEIKTAEPHILEAIEAHTRPSASGWLCIVAYVQYLWHINDLDTCIPIAAVAYHHADANDLSNIYFLQPMFYKIEQQIGAHKWQEECNAALGITIEELFQTIVKDLKIK